MGNTPVRSLDKLAIFDFNHVFKKRTFIFFFAGIQIRIIARLGSLAFSHKGITNTQF